MLCVCRLNIAWIGIASSQVKLQCLVYLLYFVVIVGLYFYYKGILNKRCVLSMYTLQSISLSLTDAKEL